MIRLTAIVLLLTAVLAGATSCMDEDPAEISVRLMQGGQPIDGLIMLFNNKGVQVQEHHTERGFVIIKQVKPGTYFVKVKDYADPPNVYPAIRKFELVGGDSEVLDIDVDDTSQNPPDFPGGA